MTKTYYVYIHRRADDGTPFYVGCATKQERRSGKGKYQRAYDFGQRKPEWFAVRDAHGVTVEIECEFDSRDDAFAREKDLIASFVGLVNISTGGAGTAGVKDPDHVRYKKAVTKIGKLNPMYGKVSHLARPVIDMQAGVFYNSIQEAADMLDFKMQTLWAKLKGKNPNNTSLRFA